MQAVYNALNLSHEELLIDKDFLIYNHPNVTTSTSLIFERNITR